MTCRSDSVTDIAPLKVVKISVEKAIESPYEDGSCSLRYRTTEKPISCGRATMRVRSTYEYFFCGFSLELHTNITQNRFDKICILL